MDFGTIFEGLETSKMRFLYGKVAFFRISGIVVRCCFGCVLGGSGEGFLRHFGPDLVDFEGSERSQISSSKLEAEKVVSKTRGGVGDRFWRPIF